MAKFINDLVYDAALNYVKNNATELYICSSQPTDRATAIAAALASKTGLTSGSFTGPADGDVSGRKLSKNEEVGLLAGANGNSLHAALCTGSILLSVTDITSQVITLGNTVNAPVFDIEFEDVKQ